jgi:hypothetical protein
MTGIILTLSLILGGCAQISRKPNQKSPSVSPSGKYILTVPVERDARKQNLPYWRVTISDDSGKILFKDDSEFVAHLNVYWRWDSEDRAWLYNSDSGRVYFWESSEGGWKRSEWGHGRVKEIDRDLSPPAEVYPDYVK